MMYDISMKNIAIIGTGYVGLVTGVCLAENGYYVSCYDINKAKISSLRLGKIPFYEPDLKGLLEKSTTQGRLKFTLNLNNALKNAQIIFICVGTPSLPNGKADLKAYFQVIEDIAKFLHLKSQAVLKDQPIIIVNKSTVPIGTAQTGFDKIKKLAPNINFKIVSNPEFLREGRAVADFMHPQRIVLGFKKVNNQIVDVAEKAKNLTPAQNLVFDLYSSFNCPKIITNWQTAEMIKYASNSFLACKISFINEIAALCDQVNANVIEVAQGIGLDSRIGPKFLQAGIGYGGSCFPKDVKALHSIALDKKYHFKLLKSVIEVNNQQREQAIVKIKESLAAPLKKRTVAILGLAFKPETDDIRESASIFIIKRLLKLGIKVKAYDPEANKNARKELKNKINLRICQTVDQVFKNVDLVFLATKWQEFLNLDWQKVANLIKGKAIIDGRNALDKNKIQAAGLEYIGFGVN